MDDFLEADEGQSHRLRPALANLSMDDWWNYSAAWMKRGMGLDGVSGQARGLLHPADTHLLLKLSDLQLKETLAVA